MPISNFVATGDRKKNNRVRGKISTSTKTKNIDYYEKDNFLTIGPALPSPIDNFALTTLDEKQLSRSFSTYDDEKFVPDTNISVRNMSNGRVHVCRTEKAKETNPDRICLDRRGLSAVPLFDDDGETHLRLLSLQHNLLSKLDGLQEQAFIFLVFLDMYDNQLEMISCLDRLENLRVLLMGKNRIKCMEGLQCLLKLEVLDLHGNQITHVTGLNKLPELKVLNLAGNQIKNIGVSDLRGLYSLQELNLRRNKLKKLLGFEETLQLQKLFLSNNEIQNVEDMSSVAKAVKLREVAIDNNPVSLGGECVSFLVSYLPHLFLLSNMQITEHVRKAAMAWRRNKENTNAAFMDLTSDVCLNVHREEIISNARTNWELLRSQTNKTNLIATTTKSSLMCKDLKTDFVLTPVSKPEMKVRSRTGKLSVLPDKKLNAIRSSSLDTENSHSSSNTSNSNELFRLPPILVPIINKLENQQLKKWGSLSSIGPNVDSSSFPSTSNSSSDTESDKFVTPSNNLPDNNHVAVCGSTDSSTGGISGTTAAQSSSGSELSCNTTSKRSIKSATNQRCVQKRNVKLPNRAATAKVKQKIVSPPLVLTQPQTQPANKDREQGGDYLIEICGRYLNVYGHSAVRFIDRPWNTTKANDVKTVKFSYINFNNLIGAFSKLKTRFPNIESLIFCETNIYCLGQLNALAEVQGFTSLRIDHEGNAISDKCWRSYAIYRLSHWGLKSINDKEITDEEIRLANEEYQSLSDLVLWSLPNVLLQPLLARLQLNFNSVVENNDIDAKKWLYTADPALKSVVSKEALQWRKGSVSQEDLIWRQTARTHMSNILEATCDTVRKLRFLDQQWPQILKDIVQDILVDYEQLDVYMKRKLQELK